MDNLENSLEKSSNFISRFTYHKLIDAGVNESIASYVNVFILLAVLILLVYIVQYLVRNMLRIVFTKLATSSNLRFFDYLLKNKFPHFLALIAPFSLIKNAIPIVFDDFPTLIKPLDMLMDIYMVFMIISIIMSIVRSGTDVLRERPAFHAKPMESYLSVVRMVFFLFGAVSIFSTVTGESPAAFFTAMGAASAVLLLMFKDSIMGFVASIQVTTNDMVRIGDWITMPKYGADGDVMEINLTTVKVQNFDKTITTIPTYTLISDSFQNWRGMQDSGGRRIKRSIIIKQSSIRFINDDELTRFQKIQGIKDYIENRSQEIKKHNEQIGADRSVALNGRNFTNFGLYRKYIDWYLNNHPGIRKDMTLMVRQLAPSENGLPLELYVFTNTTKWTEYEYIMADVFDHLIAAVPYFDLNIFELESGSDVFGIKFANELKVKSNR
ncbi:mechanosensitive ion channel family protein [Olivibacter domesticus]|uniref:Mechanosensing system component YbdG n=1 Tax=Olivibacter domesticus TaxID=407022 RepID=A0A1H7TE10_OLID1|nr:mechanosensitive ion channel domain-containing protein [Olivibacter domesticus]SEL83061.1 miniconductance mechanosensitive channel [Olivibacter domesticus]